MSTLPTAYVTNAKPPAWSCSCDVSPCEPCSYCQLRIDALNVRSLACGAASVAAAQLDVLTASQACINGLMASGTMTAATYGGGEVTATTVTATAAQASTFAAEQLVVNGASFAPQTALVAGGTYVVLAGFASNGAVVVQLDATTPAVQLPAGDSVPAGYSVAVYNLSATALTVATTASPFGPALIAPVATGLFTPAPTVEVPATSVVRFAWLGASAWLAY